MQKRINAKVKRMTQSFLDGIEQGEHDLQMAETPQERMDALSRIRFYDYLLRAITQWVICYPGENPEAFINNNIRTEVLQ